MAGRAGDIITAVSVAAAPDATISRDVVSRMAALVGPKNCVSNLSELRTYECDGLMSFRVTPGLVVLPASTAEVVAVVRLAWENGLSVVARGAGTGLSGGALPVPGCVVVVLTRMKRILEVDLEKDRQ